ncbi:MAG: low molecular weight phosphatase family protein [Euryarchaeota archaeon]|nr:low molecular weight phosphatase family protein [Euryarchaeota archaeon]MDE1835666.1 low molecular weight phosphatase family protein [Euryarchaeota archaeon]MDE1879014.1 low molecular weight phosphatase family protein [Euryarchaeota archaeon]MDE2043712.1 low molecular weight phosphatase family protein [Thermoplasmata archaeon]
MAGTTGASRGLARKERQVLFVCVENACRSLMAEAMFNANPPPGWRALSAGTRPASAPNPRTLPMLREIGLEAPAHPPVALTSEMLSVSSVRVTMGCIDDASCPARLKELDYRDWGLPDPAKLDDVRFREVRDQLRERVEGLIRELRLTDDRTKARGPTT